MLRTQFARIALTVMLMIGGIVAVMPRMTLASGDMTHVMVEHASDQGDICRVGGCQQSSACEQHCLAQGTPSTTVAVMGGHALWKVVGDEVCLWSVEEIADDKEVFGCYSIRPPPRHRFLRPIMKRE